MVRSFITNAQLDVLMTYYDAGIHAYINGVPANKNPYTGPNGVYWMNGWEHGMLVKQRPDLFKPIG